MEAKMFRKLILLTISTISLLGLAACSTVSAPNAVEAQNAASTANITQAVAAPQNDPAPASPSNDSSSGIVATDLSDNDLIVADESGTSPIDAAALDIALAALPTTALTAEEAAGLLFMREEAKLAQDVYLFLYEAWGSQIFQNIAASEQTHTDSVKALLDRYGLSDPSTGKAAGQFTDPTLQELYDQLTLQGSQSLAGAIKVGAAIEEIDILDLQERLAQTTHADIQLVYQNLEKGSRNHLRSFVNTLQNQIGETYQPKYLSLDAYQAILSASIERGGPSQGGNGAGGNGYGGNGAGNSGAGGNQP
jgi:hypothetical protein